MLAAITPPQDQGSFFLWALVIVSGTLATFTGGAMKYMVSRLDRKETECKSERKEDQQAFLAALTIRDANMHTLTEAVQKTHDLLQEHHDAMELKHDMETETISRLAGEAAIAKYLHDHPAH